MKQPIVSQLIFRVETAEFPPHAEMEDVGARNEKIYVKEYDVFLFRDEADVQEAISDAIRIAAEVTTGRKFLHITVQDEYPPLRFSPELLQAMADSGCSLEVYGSG